MAVWGRLTTCAAVDLPPPVPCECGSGPIDNRPQVANLPHGLDPEIRRGARRIGSIVVLLRAGEQARAVERVADGDHHPAHGVLGDVEAVAEVVSRPKVVEDVAARGVEDGVRFGDGSPGGGDALL